MIYTDDCCCCIDLKCGCIIIAIIDVLIRGVDRFFVDRDTWLGCAILIVSGVYVICCIFLLLGAILELRLFFIPYLFVAMVRIITLIWESVDTYMNGIAYDYLIFDVFQSVLGLYFCLVVYSYYRALSNKDVVN